MDMIAIGNRIKEAREQAHLTQEDLAEIVGISPTHGEQDVSYQQASLLVSHRHLARDNPWNPLLNKCPSSR